MLSVKQGDIKYHFFNLCYDSTWDWTPVSQTIIEHWNRLKYLKTILKGDSLLRQRLIREFINVELVREEFNTRDVANINGKRRDKKKKKEREILPYTKTVGTGRITSTIRNQWTQLSSKSKFGPERCPVYLKMLWISTDSIQVLEQIKRSVNRCFYSV